MMRCQKCEKELPEKSAFCFYCGEKQSIPSVIEDLIVSPDDVMVNSLQKIVPYSDNANASKLGRGLAVLAYTYIVCTSLFLLAVFVGIGLGFYLALNGIYAGKTLPVMLIQFTSACVHTRFSFRAFSGLRKKRPEFLRYFEIAALAHLVLAWSGIFDFSIIIGSVALILIALFYIPSSRQVRNWMGDTAFLHKSVFQSAKHYILRFAHGNIYLSEALRKLSGVCRSIVVRIRIAPKVLKIVILGTILTIALLAVFPRTNRLDGRYYEREFNIYNYVEFDGNRIAFSTTLTYLTPSYGTYELRDNMLFVEIDKAIGFGAPYDIGNYAFSFRQEGKTIWLDGKGYTK